MFKLERRWFFSSEQYQVPKKLLSPTFFGHFFVINDIYRKFRVSHEGVKKICYIVCKYNMYIVFVHILDNNINDGTA